MAAQRQGADAVLLLDTGDALVGGGALGDSSQGAAIVAAMGSMGYDAMALGPKELGLGADVLRQRLAEARFAVVSANAVWSTGGEPVAPPYAVVEVGAYRAAIVGLTRSPDGPLPDVEVLDAERALAEILPALNGEVDLVIVLTNIAYQPALELAGRVPGIDLVIAALPGQVPAGVVRVPETGTLVVCAELPAARHTGRQIGRLEVTLQADGRLAGESWSAVPLDKSLADDPAMDELLRGFLP